MSDHISVKGIPNDKYIKNIFKDTENNMTTLILNEEPNISSQA